MKTITTTLPVPMYVVFHFGSGTNLISLYSSCYCSLFKKAQRTVVSNRIGKKLGRTVLQVTTHRLGSRILIWRHIFKMAATTSARRSLFHILKRPPA